MVMENMKHKYTHTHTHTYYTLIGNRTLIGNPITTGREGGRVRAGIEYLIDHTTVHGVDCSVVVAGGMRCGGAGKPEPPASGAPVPHDGGDDFSHSTGGGLRCNSDLTEAVEGRGS